MGAERLGVDGGCVRKVELFLPFPPPLMPEASVWEVGTAIDIAGTGIKSSLKVLKTFFITFSNVYCYFLPSHPSKLLTFLKKFSCTTSVLSDGPRSVIRDLECAIWSEIPVLALDQSQEANLPPKF